MLLTFVNRHATLSDDSEKKRHSYHSGTQDISQWLFVRAHLSLIGERGNVLVMCVCVCHASQPDML